MEQGKAVYPMSVVSELTKLTARQIRHYESMDLIKPERSKGNQRLYSPEDVDTLLAIKALLAKGLTLEGIKAILEESNTSLLSEADVPLPEVDHPMLIRQLQQGAPLTSLYPVNNQITLQNLLLRRQR